VISDVLGDPLEVIASGPTVASTTTADDALDVLRALGLTDHPDLAPVVGYLTQRGRDSFAADQRSVSLSLPVAKESRPLPAIHVLGNNALAVDAAGCEAERLGYSHAMIAATASDGAAEDVGRHLAQVARRMRDEPGPDCLISGGEPTVQLADESVRGAGGRNQQLALAALTELGDCRGIVFLSGGTDGEDGPTDAAGALVTAEIVAHAAKAGLDPHDHLRRNDAYHFFAAAGGLFKTGPTQTNVCDLRVVAVHQ